MSEKSSMKTGFEEHYMPEPTDEDWNELREISDDIPKSAFLVILIEFCERFTYYGLGNPFQNYIQYPDPGSYPAAQPGAMGLGQQTATSLTTVYTFWCFITPILGAIIGDQYFGKYKTIVVFACVYMVGLLILTLTSIPIAIEHGLALPGFIIAIIIIGLGAGSIKANVSPLVAEQYQVKTPYVRELKSGERVIVTPQATYQKIFNMFYFGINIGSLSSIATTAMEKYYGFWPAYLLPTVMFVPCIAIVLCGRNLYTRNKPRGSVFIEAGRLFIMSWKIPGGMRACKVSSLMNTHPEIAEKVTWDDIFVDELLRAIKACIVFCWYPIYWLCYAQMNNNLISQAGTMLAGSVPNDIMQNLDPIALIILIPIMDRIVYPALRWLGFPMRPIFRISCGFFFAAVSMAYTAGIQAMIYNSPPYYNDPQGRPNYITAAYQIPSYFFIALSEILTIITGLEYAYKKAPQSMKSIVMALYMFTNCIGSLFVFALVPVTKDPDLHWMYTGIAGTTGICSILIYIIHYKNDMVDIQEDAIIRTDEQMEEYFNRLEKSEPEPGHSSLY